MADVYTLYGSYASYYTAKPRSYLRKKGIPFVELPPAAPRFREHVRPTSHSHRIPQLEAPDGTVVQDSVAIFEYLEARFPSPAARPPGVRQQWACRMIECLTDGTLGFPAWHMRWNFMDRNYVFVGREFGRSFRPRGSDEEIDHYGRVIADRMEGHRTALGITEDHFPALEEIMHEAFDVLERHVTTVPYLFGGLPSLADHHLMGPLFGHLARDPEPALRMKRHAPRLFRWTEHMNTPEIVWPELFDEPAEYRADDEILETTLELLRLFVADGSDRLVRSAEAFAQWVAENPDHPSGAPISDEKGADEPGFGRAKIDLRGMPLSTGLPGHPLWVLQHAQDWRDGLSPQDQKACDELLASVGGEALNDLPRPRRLCRVDGRLAVE